MIALVGAGEAGIDHGRSEGQWVGFDPSLPVPVCPQLLLGEEDSSLSAHLSGPVQLPLSLCTLGVWDPSLSSAKNQDGGCLTRTKR